jgi:hypothetical protein
MLCLLMALGLTGAWVAPATADSFSPVRLSIRTASVARRGAPLTVTVAVSADPGVLDTRDGALRVGVKLASECGGDFPTTPGSTLLDTALHPQPATGRAYSATARGSGRPSAYGMMNVCVFVFDTSAGRVYANDESVSVSVSPACTRAAARYDTDGRALAGARRALRHAHGARARRLRHQVAGLRRTQARDHAAAMAACGSGVSL